MEKNSEYSDNFVYNFICFGSMVTITIVMMIDKTYFHIIILILLFCGYIATFEQECIIIDEKKIFYYKKLFFIKYFKKKINNNKLKFYYDNREYIWTEKHDLLSGETRFDDRSEEEKYATAKIQKLTIKNSDGEEIKFGYHLHIYDYYKILKVFAEAQEKFGKV